MKKFTIHVLFLLSIVLFLQSCEQDYSPKPRAYFRIDLPEKEYQKLKDQCPFSFDFPTYAKVLKDERPEAEPCWMNIDFHRFNARIHLSYKPIDNNLETFIENSRSLTYKHTSKATDIRENLFINDSARTYGLLYDIKGDAATNIQFYITDSTNHFVRGSLYFNAPPNQDSLAPVIDFIKKDIYHLMETFKWN
ncbi:MAG: gliding motility lipoprotein GldD [Bacteroidetes bacterium]|nr:gliding motility lipoprotein GldD [Bacteroidota bacterium]HET6244189.1 gliding motility lipoprotein GldD [Bacteroidia bacterium]